MDSFNVLPFRDIALIFVLTAAAVSPIHGQDTTKPSDENSPDPYEWIIESYSFPASDLINGFASEERGELRAPAMPSEEASEEEVRDFITRSNSYVSHYLEREGFALPEGVLMLFDPDSNTLTARAPRIVQGSLSFAAETFQSSTESFLRIETTLLEAPAARMLEIAARAGDLSDHSVLKADLLEEGGVRLVHSGLSEVRSGQRTKIGGGGEVYESTNLLLGDEQLVDYDSEAREVGTVWEFDPVLGSDDITIDLNLSLSHDLAPATRRMVEFARQGETTLSAARSESRYARVLSQYTMRSGTTKFLGQWASTFPGGGEEEVQKLRQAAFVQVTAVRNLPVIEERLAAMLGEYGGAILPIPEGKPQFAKEAEEVPEGMIVRRYVIPPNFLSNAGGGAGGSAKGGASDPFAAPVDSEPRFTVRVTAKDILRSIGIPFPEGSSANFLPSSSLLVVRNTPENIQLVEAYVMSIRGGAGKSIGATLHLIQGPGELIREFARTTRGLTNQKKQWDALLAAEGTTVVDTLWLEARSGQRARFEAGREYVFPTGVHIEVPPISKREDGGALEENGGMAGLGPEFESVNVGLELEIDPVIGADDRSIDVNFSLRYDYAPPEFRSAPPAEVEAEGKIQLEGPSTQFRRANILTQTIFLSGSTRILGVWSPEGTPEFDNQDIMQALVMKLDLVSVDEAVVEAGMEE